MKEHYTLLIGGAELKLISDEPEEYVNSLARTLEKQIYDMTVSSKQCGKYEAALMLALEYLDRSKKLEDELRALKSNPGNKGYDRK